MQAGQHASTGLASLLWVGCLCVVLSIEPCDMPGGGWWLAACAACAYATYFAATYTPPTCHVCSRPASGSLSVLLPIPTTTSLSYPATSPPFRRLLCLHYTLCCQLPAAAAACSLQPPTWRSSYAATYSPPTYHVCSRPASGSLSVLVTGYGSFIFVNMAQICADGGHVLACAVGALAVARSRSPEPGTGTRQNAEHRTPPPPPRSCDPRLVSTSVPI
jgi:hypothetical protein